VPRSSSPQSKLDKLLAQRNEHPERIADIDAAIRAAFERELAIFVLDMCGFSRLTLKHGIIHYLAMIKRMQDVVLPVVEQHKGNLVKTEADNVFAVFKTVPHAYAAAVDVNAKLGEANKVLPEDWDLHVGIGIGYGPLLLIGEHDVFGSEMNLASKLGEDLAEDGDVLLTKSAGAKLGHAKRQVVAKKARMGKLTFDYFAKKPAKKR
jgi:adenylate cyclase